MFTKVMYLTGGGDIILYVTEGMSFCELWATMVDDIAIYNCTDNEVTSFV